VSTAPPRLARWLAARLVPLREREFVLGDMDELFERDAATLGHRHARAAYWRQTFSLVRLARTNPTNQTNPTNPTNRSDMRNLFRDVIIATRTALHSPTYSAITILTLALAIGANTLLFSIANPLVARALPIADPNGLGWILATNAPRQIKTGRLSMPDLLEFRKRATSFASLAGYGVAPATLTGHQQDPERIQIVQGTANLTEVWGMQPKIGRVFEPADAEPGRPIAAVLSDRYWRERFQSDAGVLGRQLLLDGKPLIITGVMPSDLEIGNMSLIDIWTPIPDNPNAPRDERTLRVLGRLAPGATLESAAAEVRAISQQQARDYPASHQDWQAQVVSTRTAMTSSETWLILVLLAIVVGFVLLIACANLANLVVARLSSRRVDLAVRQALGASRWQLVRPLLIESLLLSVIGGVCGLALAYGGLRIVNAAAYEPFLKTIGIDGNVLIFAAAISVLTPAVFALAPALSAGRATSAETLRDSRTSGGRGARRRRDVLVAGQVALALSLLVVSMLTVKSMLTLRNIDTGIDIARMATFRFELTDEHYATDDLRARFADELARSLASGGGVTSAAVISHLPVFDGELVRQIEGLDLGTRERDTPWVSWYSVTPGYFKTAGVPLLTGRAFSEVDRAGAQPVAIINRAAAERYFGGVPSAIGRQISLSGRNEPKRAVTIVAVAADTRAPVITTTSPQIYVPFAQWPVRAMTAIVSANAPDTLAPQLRAAMRSLDATVPISNLRTVRDIERDENSSSGIINGLFVAFAMLALILAAGGLYGVISYSVGQLSSEIGLRLAIGAAPAVIRLLLLSEGLKVTTVGVVVGLALGVVIAGMAAPVLYGVSPRDPFTFASVTVIVFLVSLAAVAGPALRAMRTDPAKTLRNG
jgi:putative ABC transport system permease protein